MKKVFNAFQHPQDLLLGYAIGLLDGEVIETAYLEKSVYEYKDIELKKVIFKKVVSALLQALKIDKATATKLVLETDDEEDAVIIDLSEEGKVH